MTTEHMDKPLFGAIPAHSAKLDEASVHHIRRGTKQLRARLQLLRQLEGQRQETERLRQEVKELARMLAGQRDADVLYDLIGELKRDSNDEEINDLLTDLQDSMSSKQLPADDMKRVVKLVHEIEHHTHKLARLSHPETDINRVLATRLDSLLAAGPALLASTDWEALHDWRKQVKKLMYQYQMKPSLTPRDHYVYDHLDQLGSGLGKINDLSMLEHIVREQEKGFTRAHTMLTFSRLYKLLDQRRQNQLQQCRKLFEAINNLQR